MILKHFRLNPELVNSYVVADGQTGNALLIDAGEFSPAIVDFIRGKGLSLDAVFITHSHYDHNGAVGDYLREFPAAKAYGGSSGCAGKHTIVLSDGDTIKVGTLEARVLRVGGHTPDMHVLYFPAAGVLFSGDALFAGSVGGTSSPAARDEQTGAIRAKILELPDDVRVYGGHGPPTTVYIEKHHNPFLA